MDKIGVFLKKENLMKEKIYNDTIAELPQCKFQSLSK